MSDTNMRIWDAVSKTDPAHTKKVEFGRKFTSIDAHWQVMQATKLFGPVGEGWRYTVEHSTITLTPEVILAVADVTISWRAETDDVPRSYGPIRATCEMYGPKTYKGKIIPGEFVWDEDAPKKAMTDALTKGLSHLGFSADVFLGLFDDNRYVKRMEREFSHPGDAQTQSLQVAPEDRGMVQGDGQSQYLADKAKKAKAAADNFIATVSLSGQTKDTLQNYWRANEKMLGRLEESYPAEHERVIVAFDKAMDAAAAKAA